MFTHPLEADWATVGVYERTPEHENAVLIGANEQHVLPYTYVGNWMCRLLHIQDNNDEFNNYKENEASVVNGRLHCVVVPKTQLTWLYFELEHKKVCYLAGRYNIESAEQLMERHSRRPRRATQTQIVFVAGLKNGSDPNFDVRSLQANPRNCGATFEVASHFNGLENPKDSSARREHGVARYIHADTQGHSASESCGPATLYRNYFVDGNDYHHENRTYVFDPVNMAKEVNTLDAPDLIGLLPVVNGIATFTRAPTQEDLDKLNSNAYKYVKVVRHDFAQVTYGLRHRLSDTVDVMDVCNDYKQIVNQVFNGGINAVDLSYITDEATQKKVALFLLKAGMISALLAAQENRDALANVPSCYGRKRFFPSLAGCGGSQKYRSWLMEAWCSREVFPYILNSGLDIVICFQEAEAAEAFGFAKRLEEERHPDLHVKFVDAAEAADMAAVFGMVQEAHAQESGQEQTERHATSQAASEASTAPTASTISSVVVGDRPRLKLPSRFNFCCM